MENKKIRYLKYDSLVSSDEFTTRKKYPYSSDLARDSMDILLYRSYLRGEMVLISIYNKGKIELIEDVITKLDPIKHKITLMQYGVIRMGKIVGLKGK